MILFLYDTDAANPLAAAVRGLDFDYQAEQHLLDLRSDPRTTHPAGWVVRAELHDAEGLRARWTRPDGDTGYFQLDHATPRFRGHRPTGA